MSDEKIFGETENESSVFEETTDMPGDEPKEEIISEEAEKTVSPEDEELAKELDEIRDVFQQELDKATAQAQENEENGETEEAEEKDEPEEDNLCLCCGERERMEGSDYCEDCHEAMRRYPFKLVYFLVALLAVYVAVLAVGKIAAINRGWVYAYEGDALSRAGWYTDAADKYQYAQNYLYRSNVEPKMVYIHNFENAYEQGGFNVITSFPTSVATLFEEWELNLPHMKTLKQYYMRSQVMAATIEQVNNEVFSKYSELSQKDLPYDDIIKELSAFESRMLHIGLDEDGNEIEEETTEYNGSMSTSNAVYFKRTEKYDKSMLQYFKYYFASVCEIPYEERIGFLEAVKANEPEMVWLYAADLGIEYAENGEREKAKEMAQLIYDKSETDVTSYYINALVAKNFDKDFDAAIEYCNDGITYGDNYEFNRQIALNYLGKGDYKKAQEYAQTAYDMNNSWQTVNTLAFCALANGDTDKYKEMRDIFVSYNKELEEGEEPVVFSDSVLTLRRGEATVSEILEKGGYDLDD